MKTGVIRETEFNIKSSENCIQDTCKKSLLCSFVTDFVKYNISAKRKMPELYLGTTFLLCRTHQLNLWKFTHAESH